MINNSSILALLAIFYLLIPVSSSLHLHWRQSPHDQTCYSQGLSFINQTHILQSCGLYGISCFNIYQLKSGDSSPRLVFKSKTFPAKYFLQGTVLFPANQIIYLLTWREKVIFRYRYTNESNNFQWLAPLKWGYEGWGLTHNNSHLFISDGSNKIFVVDENAAILQVLSIKDQFGNPQLMINELQWREQKGVQYIYANIYLQTVLAKISIAQQKVIERIDLEELKKDELKSGKLNYDEVLNGVAIWNETVLLTGKNWRNFYVSEMQHLDDL